MRGHDAHSPLSTALGSHQRRVALLVLAALRKVLLIRGACPAHAFVEHCLALKLASTPSDRLDVVEQVLEVIRGSILLSPEVNSVEPRVLLVEENDLLSQTQSLANLAARQNEMPRS